MLPAPLTLFHPSVPSAFEGLGNRQSRKNQAIEGIWISAGILKRAEHLQAANSVE
jgi:hypothetical protein